MAVAAAPLTPALAQAALIVAKSTLLLGAAAAGTRAMRRASAAARHLVWSLALGGLMALPALVYLLPDWKPAALAVLRPAQTGGQWAAAAAAERGVSLETVLLAVWAAGALYVLARLVRGLAAVRRMARGAEVVDDPAWTDLLERLGRAAGVRRPVALLRSPAAAMPLTWGAFRPAILLPAGSDAWSPGRRQVVLLHELAHVARRDCLMQTLAEACCAVWWFHPGAWWAARQMRIEREEACDDQVLAAGARASDYAGHLLDVARTYRVPSLAAAIAMARPSHLEGRVRAVLAAERDRRGVTGRTSAVCAGAILLASLPLAAVSPSERVEVPGTVAWELPPARTPGIHGTLEITPAPQEARSASAVRSWQAPSAAAPAPAARPAAPARRELAQRPAAERSQPHRERRTARPSTPGLVASLDADGTLRARLTLPEGVDVRVEGHGVRTAGGDLTVSLDVGDAISLLAGTGAGGDKCPNARRRRASGPPKKLASAVRRVVSNEKHQLALRILADLAVAAEGGERAPKRPLADGASGG